MEIVKELVVLFRELLGFARLTPTYAILKHGTFKQERPLAGPLLHAA